MCAVAAPIASITARTAQTDFAWLPCLLVKRRRRTARDRLGMAAFTRAIRRGNTRVPALGNKTPCQAARTADGRERLEALLGQFERDAADVPSSVAAHLSAIRAALGLTEPPR